MTKDNKISNQQSNEELEAVKKEAIDISPEELAELDSKTIAEIEEEEELNEETEENKGPEPTVEGTETAEVEVSETETETETDAQDPVEEEESSEESPAEPQPVKPTVEDLKKKVTSSAQEQMIQRSRANKFEESVAAAAEVSVPTEDEMRVLFPDWDLMDDVIKKLAVKNEHLERKQKIIENAAQESKNIAEWDRKVADFLSTSLAQGKYTQLQGHEQGFRLFCSRPSRRGLDMEDLVGAFSYGLKDTPAPIKKGSLLQTGGRGGPAPKLEMTADDAALLRTKDYRAYARAVKAGKIKIEV